MAGNSQRDNKTAEEASWALARQSEYRSQPIITIAYLKAEDVETSSHLDQTLSLKSQAGQRCCLPFPRVPISLSSLSCRIHYNSPSVCFPRETGLDIKPPLAKKRRHTRNSHTLKPFLGYLPDGIPNFCTHEYLYSSTHTVHLSCLLDSQKEATSPHTIWELSHRTESEIFTHRPLCGTLSWQQDSLVSATHALPQPCSTCPVRLSP